MKYASVGRDRKTYVLVFLILIIGSIWSTPSVLGRDLSLNEALEIAVHGTSRGEMIDGNLEVARQFYQARRINMYLPEISINGSVPSYRNSQAYQPFRNPLDRQLSKTSSLDFNSFIELRQTLLTGGTLIATADLVSEDKRYPDTRFEPALGFFVDQDSRQGSFGFVLDQPLFRPSEVRNELNNRRDDVEIARMTRTEEAADLRKEVVEAYLGVLQLSIQLQKADYLLDKCGRQVAIDSAKLADGVLSEEDFLLSGSARLDAELEQFAAATELEEQQRELLTLLDLDVSEQLSLSPPTVGEALSEADRKRAIDSWETSVAITLAGHKFSKAEREADFAASGHGLTGDLTASYSFGRQRIETDRLLDTDGYGGLSTENVKTNGWTVGLEFRLPLWDGGAGRAAVRAARYQAERARNEYVRATRSARAGIIDLTNQLDINSQRLNLISQQIDLALGRLKIAEGRQADGQISMLTLLESRIFWLETKDKYLQELKMYYLNRIALESQFIS